MGRSGYGPGGVVGANQPPDIRLTLLGGFRVEHRHVVPESAWQQRRSAKALVKVLAAQIEHALHREQVLEYLWPEVDFVSAVNSFGKALHVARRALEPDMASRGPSSYLRLSNDVISLVTDRIWIDTDHFRSAADEALRHGDVVSLESALALYTGELLPEDTYESWAIARRDELAELHLRLLFGLACALEQRGDRDEAIERHTNVLQIDPAREDVHRHLMRLYAESGRRLQALRQYQLCCEVLRQELDVPPERATVELYEEIRNGRLQTVVQVEKPAIRVPDEREHISIPRFSPTPLFGRDQVLRLLLEDFAGAESGSGFTVMVSGEVGVGKTRLVAEAAREAAREDALVLWGASSEPRSWLPYGPFGEALETYIATCDAGERQALAARYPELTRLAPSLGLESREHLTPLPQEGEQSQLLAAIVRMLTDLAAERAVVLILDDLHAASWETVQLLQHLARLASKKRWLIMGTYREEDLSTGSELQQILTSGTRQGYCRHINLRRLARHDCDSLVRAVIQPGAPSPALLEQIYAVSLGNPLFVMELIGAMQGRGELVFADGYWEAASSSAASVPRQVERLVDLRIERLDDRAQRVLSLLALSGAELSFHELWLAVHEAIDPEMTEPELLDILDAALQSRILEEQGVGYAFTHPLFSAVLHEQMSRQRRTQLHGALVHAIELSRPEEVELLTYHLNAEAEQDRLVGNVPRHADHDPTLDLRRSQEALLWDQLERLLVQGRKRDADAVRQNLRRLLEGQPPMVGDRDLIAESVQQHEETELGQQNEIA